MDERDLVERAKTDPEAVGQLYDRYVDAIDRYVRHRVGGRENVEDIVAEVFRKVVEGLPAFEWKGGGFRAWIYTIAANQVTDFHRQRGRENPAQELFQSMSDSRDRQVGSTLPSSPAPAPEDALLQTERNARLIESLSCLTAAQRELLELKFGHDLSHQEIAAVTDRSPSAVSSMLHRAIKRLRCELGKGGTALDG